MYCEQSSEEREVRAMAGRIYAERRTYLMRIAKRNAPTEADAEDALQDTFANFIQSFDPYGEAPPLAWLTTYADPRVMPTYLSRVASQADRGLARSA